MDDSTTLIVLLALVLIIGAREIVRVVGQQRRLELLQRERIAAIERGLDPARLPSLAGAEPMNGAHAALDPRLAQNLLVGGVIALAAGIGLVAVLAIVEDEGRAWAVGILPVALAAGLFAAAALVRRRRR